MLIFFRRPRAAYSAVRGRIEQSLELIRDFIAVLDTCKNEEDPIKNEGHRVLTTLYINSDAQGQIAAVSGGIWPKYELIQAEMSPLYLQE